MRKRTIKRGATAAALLALLAASPAMAGEDDTPTAPVPPNTQPVAPAPTTPAPTTPAPPAVPKPPQVKKHTQKRVSRKQTTDTSQTVAATVTTTSTDTGIVAQGGIQAGEGGMAQHHSDSGLLGLGSGLAAFAIAAGVHARRRRAFER
ncbi:MAG TPA: hypothetical protein VGI67_15700 [Thermoleophilaceae bacterium]|jgi:hypothetical protein